MKRLAIAAICLVVFSIDASAQQRPLDTRAVDRSVEAELDRQAIAGAALGIIADGRVVYTQGYGLAHIDEQTPVTRKTVFNWASNSKPVMAIAALQLVESGQLDLDAGIHRYIPSLPPSLRAVTARHLLCHQSGIPHYSNGKIVPTERDVSQNDELDPLASIQRFLNSPLLFQPGSSTDYSSYAYVLLSAVVQEAGKADIAEQLSRRIIKPLKLDSLQLDLAYNGQGDWATGYRLAADGQLVPVEDRAHFWKHGAGGYKSNVDDFAKWAAALMTSRLINRATSRDMWTRQKTANGELSEIGLGVFISGEGRSMRVSHNGSQDEVRTRMVFYPSQGHGMVVMCNSRHADPGAITTAVYRAMK